LKDGVGNIPGFPFIHAFIRLNPRWMKSAHESARVTLKLYHDMLDALSLQGIGMIKGRRQGHPYNLLVTREWMLLVPRSKEFFDSISVNSMGFAGALLLRNKEEMKALKKYGPMKVLESVALFTE